MFVASTHGERRHVDYSALEHRNSRVAAYVAAGLTGLSHWRAGQQSAHNSPGRPTRLFSSQSTHGERRQVDYSALATMLVVATLLSSPGAQGKDTAAPPF